MSHCDILGFKIEVGDKDSLLEKSFDLVGNGGIICTPNPLILSEAVENASLRRALLSADLCIPDGIGLLPYLRKKQRNAEVLPGVELGQALAGRVESIGLVGGREGIALRAFSHLKSKNPSLSPAFLLSGYETPLSVLLSALSRTKPALCLVCLGSPRQELLMQSLRLYSPKTVFLGLGGSLDVYAGAVRRAPHPFRVMHLEWLYRMLCEPHRLRALPRLLSFPILCAKHRQKNYNLTKKASASV